jgi:hypothetical protein
MKCRLEHAAVAPMHLPLGTQEPLASTALSRLERQPSEVPVVRDEHVPDVIRVGEEVEVDPAESIVTDIAIAVRSAQQ